LPSGGHCLTWNVTRVTFVNLAEIRIVAAGGSELASHDGFGSLEWWAACDGAPDRALVRAAGAKPCACGAPLRGFGA